MTKIKEIYLLTVVDKLEHKTYHSSYDTLELAKVSMLTDILSTINNIGYTEEFKDCQWCEKNNGYTMKNHSWGITKIDEFTASSVLA